MQVRNDLVLQGAQGGRPRAAANVHSHPQLVAFTVIGTKMVFVFSLPEGMRKKKCDS
jgi:hypothetical protein